MAVEIKNEKTEPAKGEIGKEFFDKLQDFMQSNFGEKQPRECPECIKCKDDSIPKYFSSLGSLKEHLLEHYKVKYYLENVSDFWFLAILIIYLSIATRPKDVTFRGMMTMNQLVSRNWRSIWIKTFLLITLKELKTNVKLNAKKNEGEKKKWYDLICHLYLVIVNLAQSKVNG